MRSSFFVARLPGGIGNQLFSLFASRYISQETGLINYLDFRGIDYSHHAQKYDISDFQLKKHETALHLKYDSKFYFGTILEVEKFKYRTSQYFPSFRSLLRLHQLHLEPFASPSVSCAIDRMKVGAGFPLFSSISGYFPDFSFFDHLKSPSDRLLSVSQVSSVFKTFEQQLSVRRILAVHVRLKDYLLHPDSIGNLSDAYFLDCINLAFSYQDYEEIWIFSDSPHEARTRLSFLTRDRAVRFIGIDEFLTPIEELVLLQKCSGIICSNSTFSFWAAKFMTEVNPNSMVFIPSSFRKDDTARVFGLPPQWISCPPHWL